RLFFVLAVTVYYAEAFLVGDQPDGADALNPIKALTHMSTQGDPVKQLLLLGLYAATALALVRKTPWRAWFFLGLPLIMLSLWSVASMAWSIDSSVTLRRSVALLGTVTFGLYLGLRFDLRTMLRLMSWVTAIVLVSSVLVAIIRPELGLDFEGRLRGVTAHKN